MPNRPKGAAQEMQILHASWSDQAMCLWGESLQRYVQLSQSDESQQSAWADEDNGAAVVVATARSVQSGTIVKHPFATEPEALRELIKANATVINDFAMTSAAVKLRLPQLQGVPLPSERLSAVVGAHDRLAHDGVAMTEIPCLQFSPTEAPALLLALDQQGQGRELLFGHSLRYWIAVSRFLIDLLSDQRFVPSLIRQNGHGIRAVWQPWFHDQESAARLEALLLAMPTVVRSGASEPDDQPWSILRDALLTMTDAAVRTVLRAEDFQEAVEDRADDDLHVSWLRGLLGEHGNVNGGDIQSATLLRGASQWIGRLDETGRDQEMHLCLKLIEPEVIDGAREEMSGSDAVWTLSLHLQRSDDPEVLIDAEELWSGATSQHRPGLGSGHQPQELMLRELGRASRIYPALEQALSGAAPQSLKLSTQEAFAFLSEYLAVLEESGVTVITPDWWGDPTSRLGVRLSVDEMPADRDGAVDSTATRSPLGLSRLVQYRWNVAVGDDVLTAEQFERLRKLTHPIALMRGRWVVMQKEDIAAAAKLMDEAETGVAKLGDVVRLAFGMDKARPTLPVLGLDAEGWLGDLFNGRADTKALPTLLPPDTFLGELRPYQLNGLRWLVFLESLGFGACLADDMGLGKTIQLIAVLLHERHEAQKAEGATVDPTLLIVPTSLIANWNRELHRFAPSLKAQIHHGADRPMGQAFVEQSNKHDVVITTYGLISRDRETLSARPWGRVVLDEAQYIKNPPTKQTAAIRALDAPRRVALTGTPLENRLSELWSILEFCNPGYLGSASEFRRLFAVPVERHRDADAAQRLRKLVQPFVLRRLKTDPTVISDLPPCLETKEFATLTAEQAAIYQNIVDRMLNDVNRAEGMQRRGMVLAALVKLKQACNHPSLLDKDAALTKSAPGALPLAERSGKCSRLLQMLEELIAVGDKALIFTQFRQMGHLLSSMIQHAFDCEPLFLHGGTAPPQRQKLIDRFQEGDHRTPIFILSLKAGGLGLNLTAANHVFHFDRWWNPAVENQATDRAFRIGQTRTVHVHKFVCQGTLEERIDEMLEQKRELSTSIIGSGEQWLTELDAGQLHELLQLRQSAWESDE